MSEAEEFLNSIRCLDMQINALDTARVQFRDRRQDLLDKAACISASLNGVCVQTGVSDKVGSIGTALADLPTPEQYARKLNSYQDRLNRKIDELIDKKQKALDTIAKVKDAKLEALLTHRYINNLKWSTIADIMGYTQDWVEMRLKRQAIEAYEEAGSEKK